MKSDKLSEFRRSVYHIRSGSVSSSSSPPLTPTPKVVFVSTGPKAVQLELRHILANKYESPVDATALEEFADFEYRGENVRFLLDVVTFRVHKTVASLLEHGAKIVTEYITEGSPEEVNISANTRLSILQAWDALVNKESLRAADEEAIDIKELENVFRVAWDQVYEMVDKDILPRFQEQVIEREKCSLARSHALWCFNPPTISTFFTFPSPIDTAESRIHAVCCGILGGVVLLLNFLYGQQKSHVYSVVGLSYLCYGYIARLACGPRMDPQAFLILFIVRPIVVDYLRILKSQWTTSGPRRFAQLAGAVMSTTTLALYLTKNNLIAFIVLTILVALNFVQAFLNYCVGCAIYYKMMQFGLVSTEFSIQDRKYIKPFQGPSDELSTGASTVPNTPI